MPTIYSPSTVAPPDRSRPARQRARAVVSAVLSVVLALLGVVGLASPAAAGVDHVSGHWGHYGTIPTWWGTMTFSGRYGLCVDPGVLPPTLLDDATAHKVCGNSTGGTPDDNAQLAYLLARYLDTDDEATAVSLSQIGRGQYHDGIPVSYPNRLGQMLDEARRNAGPKDAFIQVDADALRLWYGLVRRGESSRDFSHFHPGYTATLRITTPNVTFTDGSQTMTVTTKDAAASVPLISRHDLIADEKVSVTVTIGGIESSCYLRHEPGGHHQRVATPLRESASASATHAPKVTRWQPKVTTEISTPTLTKDAASVTDRVKADAVNGSQWPVREWANAIQTQPKTYYSFTATGDLVRASTPPAPSTSLPAGASVVATGAKATLTGPGVWTTTTVPMSDGYGSGHYALRWCLDAAAQGVNAKYLPIGGPFCDSYFADSERFIVPMTLGISSQVPVRFHPKGQAPDDTITVFLPDSCDQWIARADGTPATLTATGIFCAASDSTFTPSDTPPADAQILGTASVTVTLPTSGRNPVTVDAPAGFTVPTAQYGVWIWHINRADQTPDVAALFDNDPTDTFGQISETHVTQMDLTIASEVTHATIPEPADDGQIEVCDTVWLEQGSEGDLWLNQWGTTTPVEVLVTGSLFHSAVPAAMTLNPDPATTNKVADFSLAFTAAGRDRAQTVCHPVSHGQYGAYGFMYSIEPDKQPAATRDFLAHGD
ncbi:MAG: hypothetical protein LBB54_04915, partial [Cellulomonadaceae bacterium]|nr:hypothetical protein [Cellulomonadaceae bacterium]